MKYIKTYENFNGVNESWFQQAYEWIKEKLSSWISKLTGEVKEGAESAMEWIKENTELMEEALQKLKQQSQSELMKLWDWIKSFVGNPLQIQPIVKESVEEESETILEKIARISGASVALLSCFGAPVAAFLGLATNNGLLFLIGAVVSIIAWSLASLFHETT
jgi:predicted nuclease with TOPRIM domain